VTLHDYIIDREGWAACGTNGAQGFALLPHALTSALLGKGRDRATAWRKLTESFVVPVVGDTLQLLLRVWNHAVDAALSEGQLAELLALDAVLSRIIDALVSAPTSEGASVSMARCLTATDLAFLEGAVQGFRDALLDGGQQHDDECEVWLDVTLPQPRDDAQARNSSRFCG
jgi:hypothetical protein